MEEAKGKGTISTYGYILIMSMLALFLMAIKVNLIDLNFVGMQRNATMASGVTNSEGDATLKNAIDGRVYDNIHAPIYTGDAYKDNKKQAMKVRKYIRPYLKKKGYAQYTDVIVAMCAQESRFGSGDSGNWMQVKGYCGKSGIESVKSGADHFIALAKKAKKMKCKDLSVLIQSYNFGTAYIDYCMKHGGKDTLALRSQFQNAQRSKLRTKIYGDFSYAEKIEKRIKGTN